MAELRSDDMQKFLGLLAGYEREFKPWVNRTEKIIKRYKDDDRKTSQEGEGRVRFNILWSNVQTLVPATFSKLPKPDVSRRYRDQDPVGRVSALILERALDYEVQHYSDFRSTMKSCVLDRFLGGRGTAWARYEPHIKAAKEQLPVDGLEITEDVDEPGEELDYECAPVDYVHWKDFGHSVGRNWEEVDYVWRRVYMQMPAKIERFGKSKAGKIPKDSKPKDGLLERQRQDNPEGVNDEGSWIYELWDKNDKKVYWFHKSMKDLLDEKDDPLGLDDFFPCPRPVYATLTNDSLVPTPDFALYQDQAKSLDTLADRIYGLVDMLQVKGVYDASQDKSIGRVFTEGTNGNLLPVKNWAAFAEKNGLKGCIEVVDLDPIARALKEAYQAFTQIVEYVYQITGIADIVRGVSNPNETLGAQEIKQNFVGLRLGDMKTGVAQFATELLQLKAQIMCAKFDPQTIFKISAAEQLMQQDQQYIGPALSLLVGEQRMQNPEAREGPNPMRSFRVEVAADSLIQMDEQAEKENRMEFLKANGVFMDKATQLVANAGASGPIIIPLIMEMWKFGVTGFKVGKTIEGAFDEAAEKLKALAANPPQSPPDPQMAKVQAQAQADQQRLQHDQQVAAAEHHREEMNAQREIQAKVQEMQMEDSRKQREMQATAQIEQFKSDAQVQIEKMKLEFERWKAELDAATKITIAEISAKASLDQSLIQAEASANAEVNADLTDGGEGVAKEQAKSAKRTKGIDRLAEMHAKTTESQGKMHQQAMEAHGKTSEMVGKLAEAMSRPKKVIRGADGKVSGIQ